MSEVAALPQPIDHVMPVAPLGEVGRPELVRRRPKGTASVDAPASRRHIRLGDIASDDANIPVHEETRLVDHRGDGIRLPTGRASRAPNSESPLVSVTPGEPRQ